MLLISLLFPEFHSFQLYRNDSNTFQRNPPQTQLAHEPQGYLQWHTVLCIWQMTPVVVWTIRVSPKSLNHAKEDLKFFHSQTLGHSYFWTTTSRKWRTWLSHYHGVNYLETSKLHKACVSCMMFPRDYTIQSHQYTSTGRSLNLLLKKQVFLVVFTILKWTIQLLVYITAWMTINKFIHYIFVLQQLLQRLQ